MIPLCSAKIAEERQFSKFAGANKDAATTTGRKITNQRMDLLFRCNVDALRRLVQKQHGYVTGEPFCENNFLLVAAR